MRKALGEWAVRLPVERHLTRRRRIHHDISVKLDFGETAIDRACGGLQTHSERIVPASVERYDFNGCARQAASDHFERDSSVRNIVKAADAGIDRHQPVRAARLQPMPREIHYRHIGLHGIERE
jgi:hypothetical protein